MRADGGGNEDDYNLQFVILPLLKFAVNAFQFINCIMANDFGVDNNYSY